MADILTQRNIAALVSQRNSVRPQSSTGGTINGAAIDRFTVNNPGSCVVHTSVGAISGSPTTSSVTSKLQHSADNSTWADFTDDQGNGAASALTAQNTAGSTGVDLANANRYIRVVTTVAFTGGTSPAALVSAGLILAGEDRLPAA